MERLFYLKRVLSNTFLTNFTLLIKGLKNWTFSNVMVFLYRRVTLFTHSIIKVVLNHYADIKTPLPELVTTFFNSTMVPDVSDDVDFHRA